MKHAGEQGSSRTRARWAAGANADRKGLDPARNSWTERGLAEKNHTKRWELEDDADSEAGRQGLSIAWIPDDRLIKTKPVKGKAAKAEPAEAKSERQKDKPAKVELEQQKVVKARSAESGIEKRIPTKDKSAKNQSGKAKHAKGKTSKEDAAKERFAKGKDAKGKASKAEAGRAKRPGWEVTPKTGQSLDPAQTGVDPVKGDTGSLGSGFSLPLRSDPVGILPLADDPVGTGDSSSAASPILPLPDDPVDPADTDLESSSSLPLADDPVGSGTTSVSQPDYKPLADSELQNRSGSTSKAAVRLGEQVASAFQTKCSPSITADPETETKARGDQAGARTGNNQKNTDGEPQNVGGGSWNADDESKNVGGELRDADGEEKNTDGEPGNADGELKKDAGASKKDAGEPADSDETGRSADSEGRHRPRPGIDVGQVVDAVGGQSAFAFVYLAITIIVAVIGASAVITYMRGKINGQMQSFLLGGGLNLLSCLVALIYVFFSERQTLTGHELHGDDQVRWITGRRILVWPLILALALLLVGQCLAYGLNLGLKALVPLLHVSPAILLSPLTDLHGSVLMQVYVLLVLPLTEEIIFRGVIMNGLRRFGRVFAIITSAFLCAFMQMQPTQMIWAFLVGLVLGALAMEYGLVWSIAAHILANIGYSGLVVTWLSKAPVQVRVGAALVGGLVVLTGLVILVRRFSSLMAYARRYRAPKGVYASWRQFWLIVFCLCSLAVAVFQFT